MIRTLLARLQSDPALLLLLDTAGAALTAILTAFVLAPARLPTGLPSSVLYLLAAIAAAFCLFGLASRAAARSPIRTLRQLAVANVAYCAATAVLCVIHRDTLTVWGLLYFAAEVAIVVTLASVEWRLRET